MKIRTKKRKEKKEIMKVSNPIVPMGRKEPLDSGDTVTPPSRWEKSTIGTMVVHCSVKNIMKDKLREK